METIFLFMSLNNIGKFIRLSKQNYELYKSIDVNVILSKFTNKHKQLAFYIHYYQYLPKSGSIEWLNARKGTEIKPPTIGGSELKDAINKNKKIYQAKLGVDTFNGNDATRWGHLTEPIAINLIELIANTTVYETGSLPGLKNQYGQTIQTYTPDGLCVIELDKLYNLLHRCGGSKFDINNIKYLRETIRDKQYLSILLENKSPVSRLPELKLCSAYNDQVYTGLDTIKFVDCALFMDCGFRRCSIEQLLLQDDTFNTTTHPRPFEEFELSPLVSGFVGVYAENETRLFDSTDINIMHNEVWSMIETKHDILISIIEYDNSALIFPYQTLYISSTAKLFIRELITKLYDCITCYLDNASQYDIIKYIEYICEYARDNFHNCDCSKCIFVYNTWNQVVQYIPEVIRDLTDYNDLGVSFDFSRCLKLAITDKHNSSYRLYYPNNNFYNISMGVPNDVHSIDYWYKIQIDKLKHYCYGRFNLIGIIPWKLYKFYITPVMRIPNYMADKRDSLEEITNDIFNIKLRARDLIGVEKQQYYEKAINKLFTSRKKKVDLTNDLLSW